jgi:hypothetical protein
VGLSATLVLAYFVYIVECSGSHTLRKVEALQVCPAKGMVQAPTLRAEEPSPCSPQELDCDAYSEELKGAVPVVVFQMECHHLKSRDRLEVFTDHSGNRQPRILTTTERIVTDSFRHEYRCQHVFGTFCL